MNVVDPSLTVAVGRLDIRGRLIEAEGRLYDLNARAGGSLGAPLAVPVLAQIARLALRLGIAVSRAAVAADGEEDLELWVRAEPDAEGVTLRVNGWRPRPQWQTAAAEDERDSDFYRFTGDWTWETDTALRLTFLPVEAGVRHGFDAGAMLGQPLTRLFALEENALGEFPILGAVAAQARFDGQPAGLRGTGRMVRLSASPRIDAEGRFAGFLGAAEMLKPKPEPEAVADAVPVSGSGSGDNGFSASFGLQLDKALRGPLGRIIACADSINAGTEGPIQPDYADYAWDIASAGRHLLALIDDLVDLDAIEREDFAIPCERIDLAEVARRATGLLMVRANEARVRIDCPDERERVSAVGDFRRALQVMVNLIGNAIYHSPSGSTVWIRLEREATMAHVIVADQGHGIAFADQERIFEKFFRIDPAESGGSGLGLYIARRLARAMGGEIQVDSAAGMGARFLFSLPVRERVG